MSDVSDFQITEIMPLELRVRFSSGCSGRIHITEVGNPLASYCQDKKCHVYMLFSIGKCGISDILMDFGRQLMIILLKVPLVTIELGRH